MKKQSNARFWGRYILISLAVVIVGVVLIVLLEGGFNFGKVDQNSTNPAKGLSDFYADYRMGSNKPKKRDLGDFVLDVPTPDRPMDERLADMESRQSTLSSRWQGEFKYRKFDAGSTLREAISNYAQTEGMQVLWELDQDFIIKAEFQLQDTIVGSLEQISQAIGANFERTVSVWFCPKQRALVITEQHSDYLNANCKKHTEF